MGLLDKVKSMKNALTGGAATVYVDLEDAQIGSPFAVTVRVQSKDAEVKYNRVYLKVEGIEKVEVPDVDVQYNNNGDRTRRREIVRARSKTLQQELTVAEGGVLSANESVEWTVEVKLPEGATPPFRGKYTDHHYQVFAGLDCFGNDPDSGWKRLHVA